MTKAGIYKITNKINGKIYIGQSINLEKRLNEHVLQLTKFKHPNNYLQNSVNKYNLENFIFEIIETLEPFDKNNKKCLEQLNYLESFYIDSYETLLHQNGYNIRNGGQNRSGYYLPNTINYIFYSPDNIEIKIDNLNKFCDENNLEISGMRRVFYEELSHYKNWTKYKKKAYQAKYILKSPDNIIFEFDNLKQFAFENNLTPQLLSKVLTGVRVHHKFWTLPDTKLNIETTKNNTCPINKMIKYNWINLTTNEEYFGTVSELVQNYKLPQASPLYTITNPNTSDKQFYNWTLKNIDKIKHLIEKPIYKFKHKTHGFFEGTRKEFILKHPELIESKVSAIINKKRPHHKGWYLIEE